MTVAPLFTMLTKQKNSSMFCIISFVKKRKGKWSYYLGRPAHTISQWSIFKGDQPTHSHWSIFKGQPAHTFSSWSIFKGDLLTHAHTGLFSGATCPHNLTLVYFYGRPAHTHLHWSIFRGTCPSGKRKEWSHCNGWPTQAEEWPHCNGWPTQIKKHEELVAL
jgi:hypothetical protein